MASHKFIFVLIASFLMIALFATNGNAETCEECKWRECARPCNIDDRVACDKCKNEDIPRLCKMCP
uniref:Uncharacterized protein n=1 Tax=Meloidogyne hapla TaxID=6305 RepID=A0A1I8BNP0_MELHA